MNWVNSQNNSCHDDSSINIIKIIIIIITWAFLLTRIQDQILHHSQTQTATQIPTHAVAEVKRLVASVCVWVFLSAQ